MKTYRLPRRVVPLDPPLYMRLGFAGHLAQQLYHTAPRHQLVLGRRHQGNGGCNTNTYRLVTTFTLIRTIAIIALSSQVLISPNYFMHMYRVFTNQCSIFSDQDNFRTVRSTVGTRNGMYVYIGIHMYVYIYIYIYIYLRYTWWASDLWRTYMRHWRTRSTLYNGHSYNKAMYYKYTPM